MGLSLSCKNGSEHLEIGLNEKIHHDNFVYLVTGFEVLSVDEYTKRYVVKFKVINNDEVLKHTWKNSIAYIVDSKGNIYNNNKKLQIKLNELEPFEWQNEYHTYPKSEETTTLIFDLPKKVAKPYLKVKGEFFIGDVLDLSEYKKMKVKLF
ncbi:hypothetical protein [Gillisia hiemivivida]|uniref:DUF4352 domain-containing protein n=1 Tax=Gillisia hiemivivida TaxID=291190 RepID=A0A5C6ZUV7_9FLAO|nr:hypothetical protein [Gillisia hiemivivida]TXD94548.1 hypothetical protein ES724_05930 [Gillisia hiemivivida]